MEILDIDLNLDMFDLKIIRLHNFNLKKIFSLPEIVFKYIKYSKFEISRLCHRCVIFAERNNCFDDANDVRLKKKKINSSKINKQLIRLPLLW